MTVIYNSTKTVILIAIIAKTVIIVIIVTLVTIVIIVSNNRNNSSNGNNTTAYTLSVMISRKVTRMKVIKRIILTRAKSNNDERNI